MLRVTFFVALALFVSVIAFFATAFHVPLTHHPKSIDELRLSSAQKLLQIHRSLHARGHQPKGARLIQKLEEGNVGLFPNVPMSDNVMAGSYTGPASIGTPAQTFDLVFDTGSSTGCGGAKDILKDYQNLVPRPDKQKEKPREARRARDQEPRQAVAAPKPKNSATAAARQGSRKRPTILLPTGDNTSSPVSSPLQTDAAVTFK